MAASPDNYAVLKGIVTFDGTDLGNAPKITISPDFTTLDHESSRAGVKSVDKTVVISQKVNISITLDEFSEFNMRLGWMANASGSPISIFSLSEREGEMIVTGTNDVGPAYTYTFPSVSLLPAGDRDLISDEWGTLELQGTINGIEGVFGTIAAVV